MVIKLTVAPVTLQIVGVWLVNVTGLSDKPPVALTAKLPALNARFGKVLKVIVCAALAIVMDCGTAVAVA